MPDPPAGPPPTEVTAELAALSAALDQVVPAKSATNLLGGSTGDDVKRVQIMFPSRSGGSSDS